MKRRVFLKTSTATLTSMTLPISLSPSKASAQYIAAIIGIVTVVYNLYSSSKKVSVPDPTIPLLLELLKVMGSIQDRLTSIEGSLATILRKIEDLKQYVDVANENSAARTAAIDLNGECRTFTQFALNPATTQTELRGYLKDVSASRDKLDPRSDIHALSLCSAAHTELAGHELICSDRDSFNRAAERYISDFRQMLAPNVPGNLVSMKKVAKAKRDNTWWFTCVNLLHVYPRDKIPTEFSIYQFDNLSLFFDRNRFGVWSFFENTYAQYDYDLSRQIGFCAYVMFRKVPGYDKEAPLTPIGLLGAKASTVFRLPGSPCSKARIEVKHALHDLIADGGFIVEESEKKFPDEELNRVPFLSEFSFETLIQYNSNLGYLNSVKSPNRDNYFLAYGLDPRPLELPLHDRQLSRNDFGPFDDEDNSFHTGGWDRPKQPHNIADEIARKDKKFSERKSFIAAKVMAVNEAQQAYISLAYMEFAVRQTLEFVENFVSVYQPDDPCGIPQ